MKQAEKRSLIPTPSQCEAVSALLKNLAHPQRLMILCQLCEGGRTVGQLEEVSGASQSQVSQFLARMKSEDLVEARREGQSVEYSIKDPRVKKLIAAMHRIFCV